MKLVPRELDKLILHQTGYLAQKRLARGLRLNQSEAVALIASQLAEFIRDGRHSVADLMDLGKQFLGRRQVMPGVAQMLHEVQIEGTFPDGSKLVTVHDPISNENGNLELALHGSFLPIPDVDRFFPPISAIEEALSQCPPGAVITAPGTLTLNKGRERLQLEIMNTGDRPILVSLVTATWPYVRACLWNLEPCYLPPMKAQNLVFCSTGKWPIGRTLPMSVKSYPPGAISLVWLHGSDLITRVG
jgi:urease gamma subunit